MKNIVLLDYTYNWYYVCIYNICVRKHVAEENIEIISHNCEFVFRQFSVCIVFIKPQS